jgi:LysM repeat protein
MTPLRILAPSLVAIALSSCASQKADEYDTPNNPYGSPDAALAAEPSNPIYDTPAAYEESTAAVTPDTAPSYIPSTAPVPAAPPSNGAAIIHTVVAGDTLSGISAKYKVPSASIKQANGMTKDIVVLGRKMVIPPQ